MSKDSKYPPVEQMSIKALQDLLTREQLAQIERPEIKSGIELLIEKHDLRKQAFDIRHKHQPKHVRLAMQDGGNLPDNEKGMLLFSVLIPHIIVWLSIGYIALFGI